MSEEENLEKSSMDEEEGKYISDPMNEDLDYQNTSSLSKKFKILWNGVYFIVEINKKLREELSSTFEGYVKMLSKWDLLRKEKLDLQ